MPPGPGCDAVAGGSAVWSTGIKGKAWVFILSVWSREAPCSTGMKGVPRLELLGLFDCSGNAASGSRLVGTKGEASSAVDAASRANRSFLSDAGLVATKGVPIMVLAGPSGILDWARVESFLVETKGDSGAFDSCCIFADAWVPSGLFSALLGDSAGISNSRGFSVGLASSFCEEILGIQNAVLDKS